LTLRSNIITCYKEQRIQILQRTHGGAVSGAIASTGVGLVGSMVMGGVGSVASSAITGDINNVEDVVWSFGIGTIAGAAGHGIGRVFDHMAANAAWSSATRSAKKMAIRETGTSNAMVNEVLHATKNATKNAFTELAKNGTNNQVLRSILTRGTFSMLASETTSAIAGEIIDNIGTTTRDIVENVSTEQLFSSDSLSMCPE